MKIVDARVREDGIAELTAENGAMLLACTDGVRWTFSLSEYEAARVAAGEAPINQPYDGAGLMATA